MHQRLRVACGLTAALLFPGEAKAWPPSPHTLAQDAEILPVIIDGAEVTADDPGARTVVSLSIKIEAMERSCSGVIIGERWVLTAGHCLLGASGVGISFPFSPPESYTRAQTFYLHPEYAKKPDVRTTTYDFALIQLPADVPEPYRPASIEDVLASVKLPGLFTAYGFGLDERGMDGTLRKATIFAPDIDHFRLSIHPSYGPNICNGDSGGPIFFEDRLIAINSAVDKNGCKGGWSMGAVVAHGLPWIKDVMAADDPAQ